MPTAIYKAVPGIRRTVRFMPRDEMRPKQPRRRAFRTHALAVPATVLPVDCVGTGCQWPMNDNDRLGDCGEAMAAHTAGILSHRQGKGKEILFTDAQIDQQYYAESGGDNGMDEDMERDLWLKQGVCGDPRCKAEDLLDIDPNDEAMLQYCLDQFYALNMAWSVPDALLDQFHDGAQFLAPMTPDPNNGHYTTVTNVDKDGNKTVLTWGGSFLASKSFLSSVEPSYFVVFSLLQFDPATGYDSHGRHISTQIAAWNAIGGNVDPAVAKQFPPPSPVTPPPPPAKPQTVTVQIPAQTVKALGMFPITIPAQIAHGVVDATVHATGDGMNETAATITIPPWAVLLLKVGCAMAPALPPPYGPALTALCALLSEKHVQRAVAGEHVALTIPPEVLALLGLACAAAPAVPNPIVKAIFTAICAFVPRASAKCRCQH